MNKEIEKLSDLELTNYFVNRAVPNTRGLTEEERLYREELLKRLSKNNWRDGLRKRIKTEDIEGFNWSGLLENNDEWKEDLSEILGCALINSELCDGMGQEEGLGYQSEIQIFIESFIEKLIKNNIEEFKRKLIKEIEEDFKKKNIFLMKRMVGLGTVIETKVREDYIKDLINKI